MNVIHVKMADLNTVTAPDHIKTTGLGSCVGILLYDTKKKIAGMAHIMLPDSNLVSVGELNKAKYADTAIPLLLEEMQKLGAIKRNIVAKIAGGSQMFKFKVTSDMMRIGPRNVDASKEMLSKYEIPIIAEDVGGDIGRTIEFDTVSGILHIRTANQGVTEI